MGADAAKLCTDGVEVPPAAKRGSWHLFLFGNGEKETWLARLRKEAVGGLRPKGRITWLGVLGKRRLKATLEASSFGGHFP